jgi:proteic killer suppression protein
MAQFDCLSETQPPQRLLFVGFPCVNPTYNNCLPGLVLHELAGQRKGTWTVRVSGNWRITFTFDGVDACDVDLEDYH